jgi:hypothetical protein
MGLLSHKIAKGGNAARSIRLGRLKKISQIGVLGNRLAAPLEGEFGDAGFV